MSWQTNFTKYFSAINSLKMSIFSHRKLPFKWYLPNEISFLLILYVFALLSNCFLKYLYAYNSCTRRCQHGISFFINSQQCITFSPFFRGVISFLILVKCYLQIYIYYCKVRQSCSILFFKAKFNIWNNRIVIALLYCPICSSKGSIFNLVMI